MGSTGPQKLVTVVRSGLAGDVQYVRRQRDLSLEVVCGELGWQQSKLSRMENGQQCISTADLASLLVVYKVKGRVRGQLLHLVDRQDEPGRWIVDAALQQKPLVRLEAEAISLVSAEPLLIPGLVQTAEYALAVMKADDVPPNLIETRLEARKTRQLVLNKPRQPKFDIILEESVLRRQLGGSAVMARQLRALQEAAERPNVRLWIVPSKVSADVGFYWSVYIMGFPRDESVIQLENKGSAIYLEDKEKIELCHRYAAKLGKAALNVDQSMDLLAMIRKE
ncbi:MAG TPA: helix-turn-helix transcriptional regulator [Pseudonocardiaceae bacterium]